jgi:hypothetical protein
MASRPPLEQESNALHVRGAHPLMAPVTRITTGTPHY